MNFLGIKGVLKSKTIWGVIIAGIGACLGWDTGTQAELTGCAMDIVAGVMQVAGAGLAIYGRVKADKKISITGK